MPPLAPSKDDPSSTAYATHTGSESPVGPPYSPITPVLRTATLSHAATTMSGPPVGDTVNGPVSGDSSGPATQPVLDGDDRGSGGDGGSHSNPDVIALRSALSVLQIQRLRATRDLAALEAQKRAAVARPEAFARALVQGRVRSTASAPWPDRVATTRPPRLSDGAVSNPDETDADSTDGGPNGGHHVSANDDADADAEGATAPAPSPFNPIPAPQTVVRCPPINWAQYHVVGEVLDRLHDEQKCRPTSGGPGAAARGTRAEPVVAAPYDPWKDSITSTSRSGA